MPTKLLVIEERVPGPEGAIRLYSPEPGGAPGRRPYRSGFVQALAEAIAARQRKPTLLVGPTRRVARQWIDTIARTGMPVFNVHATTPSALCYDLAASDLAKVGVSVASRQATLMIVEKILRSALETGQLRYFPKPPSLRRLAERMMVTLCAMRLANLDGTAVRGRKPFGDTPKAGDLAHLLDEYDRELRAEKLVDAAMIAVHARQAVESGDVPFDWQVILVPKGLDRKPIENQVFDSLGARVQELPVDECPASFADPAKALTLSFSRAIGEANEVRSVLRRCVQDGIHLDEVELLHTDESTYPPIVQEILAVMQGAGTDDLPVTFAEGLPIRGSTPARALAAWLAWRASKHPQWMLGGMLRDGLVNLRPFVSRPESAPEAASESPPGGCPDPHADAVSEDRDSQASVVTKAMLIRELRQLVIDLHRDRSGDAVREAIDGLERSPLTSFQRSSRSSEDEPEFDQNVALAIKSQRIAALGSLAELIDAFFDCEPAKEAKAGDVLRMARSFLEKLASARSQFDNNARNRLVAEITDRERWLEKHPTPQEEDVVEWLHGLLESLVVMGSAPRPGCLHVSSVRTGGHSGRPVTFIVGLDETRFPRAATTDPVLPDHDRSELDAGLETSWAVAAKSRSEFWDLLGRLRGEVHLSYSCRDLSEQAEVFPSPVILEAYRRSLGSTDIPLATFVDAIAAGTESFVPGVAATAITPTEWWLAHLGENPSMEAVQTAASQHGVGELLAGLKAEEARRSPGFTAWDGCVPDAGPTLDPSAADGRPASAHSLESLGACPRRFFFKYGLDVQASETLEPDMDKWLDPLEKGRVMHAVLETFMRRFVPTAENPSPNPIHPVFARDSAGLHRILEEVLAEKRATKPTNDTNFERVRDDLVHTLNTFLKGEEAYCIETKSTPVALEAAIGVMPKDQPTIFDRDTPVPLPLVNERIVQVRGYVDRIDRDGRTGLPDTYSIIDYKSGSSTTYRFGGEKPLAVFNGGRRLQHGLYVLMVGHVAQASLAPASTVTTFTYVFPGARGSGERLQWTRKELADVVTVVDKLCGIVAAGAFVSTNDPSDCRYCDYQEVCGDPERTANAANHKLTGPALANLFDGLRKAKDKDVIAAPIVREKPEDFVQRQASANLEPDDIEERAAIREELGTSFIVHASAGTGKTACLVDRMVSLIRTGTANIREIVATTFTKKAAAELKRRFRENLEQEATDPNADPVGRARLDAALRDIDSACIGTVHAFCGILLHERPIEAGLDPSLEMLDAAAEDMLLSRSWHEFCDRASDDPTLNPLRRELVESGIDPQDLKSAFRTFVAHADVQDWPTGGAGPPDVPALAARVCSEIDAKLPIGRQPWHLRGTDKVLENLESILRSYKARPDDTLVTLMKVLEECEKVRAEKLVQDKWWPEAAPKTRKINKAEIQKWWEGVQSDIAQPLIDWRAHRYKIVIRFLRKASDHYDKLRLANGVLSFADLLNRTARLLREKPAIRVALAERYRFLLVDEFQDTDPIQAEIMLLLAAADPEATDWKTTMVRPGSLFVVGDPQQSIYRFRRASIEVFDFVTDRIKASGGRQLNLRTNFRAHDELVSWVNGQFSNRFGSHRSDQAAFGPAFTPSSSGRTSATSGVLTGLRQLRIHGTSVVAEAEAVATFIQRAIANKLTVPRTDQERERGISPECRPEDFMIVTGDTGKLAAYAAALNSVGLACDVNGQKGVDSEAILRTFRLCLQVVADPDDGVAVLAVLRSPVFGFSDAELYALRRAGGRIQGRLYVPETLTDEALRRRFTSAREAFKRWRKVAAVLPLAAALDAIARDSGVLLLASAADGQAGLLGRTAAGAIMTLIERIRAERQFVTSMPDVVELMKDLVSKEYPRQDFNVTSIDVPKAGAVRIMNLHKAKGLEAPVVFLCDDDGAKQHQPPSCHVSRTGGESRGYLAVRRSSTKFGNAWHELASPPDWKAFEAIEQCHLYAENLRKKYVAGTRPGCCLIVTVFTKKDGSPSGGWSDLAPDVNEFADLPNLPDPRITLTNSGEPLPDTKGTAEACAKAQGAISVIYTPTYGTLTPRDILTKPSGRLRHASDGLGEEWGTIIHLMLELAIRNQHSPRGDFDLEAIAVSALAASDLADSGLALTELSELAVALVRGVQQLPLWQRINSGGESYTEVPFTVCAESATPYPVSLGEFRGRHTSMQSLPVIIRGQIDVVFREEFAQATTDTSRWVIVDWKTTAVIETDIAELTQSYGPQVKMYANIWATPN